MAEFSSCVCYRRSRDAGMVDTSGTLRDWAAMTSQSTTESAGRWVDLEGSGWLVGSGRGQSTLLE